MRQESAFVVDNDEDSLMLLGELLEAEGLRPRLFRVAEDALEALGLARELPDLFLVDLRMPDMGGSALLETLRREPRWRHLAVIVFTAWNDVARASRLGMPVIRKPDVEGLLATIAGVRRRGPRAAQKAATAILNVTIPAALAEAAR